MASLTQHLKLRVTTFQQTTTQLIPDYTFLKMITKETNICHFSHCHSLHHPSSQPPFSTTSSFTQKNKKKVNSNETEHYQEFFIEKKIEHIKINKLYSKIS